MLGVPLERIEVIAHGVEPTFSPGDGRSRFQRRLQGRPFLLFVGDPIAEPRKNFRLLYEGVSARMAAARWAAAWRSPARARRSCRESSGPESSPTT